jgi:hypothetical protein
MATPTTLPTDTTEARNRFFARYSSVVGGTTWAAVQRYLGLRIMEPATVEAWIEVAETVRDRATQRPTTITPAGQHSFTLRARIGSMEGPYTITAASPAELTTAVQQLLTAPGIEIIEEARQWQTLPDGTPICPKHHVPMRLREK